LSKANMFVQISFCVLVLMAQVIPRVPQESIFFGSIAVLFIAASSGFDYVASWTMKAIASRQEHDR